MGVVLGGWQNKAKAEGRVDIFGRLLTSVVAPVGSWLGSSFDSASDFRDGLFRARGLGARNRELEEQVRKLQTEKERADRLETEVAVLKQLLSAPTPENRGRVGARIVGFSPRDNRITLNVGSKQGLKAGLAVLGPEGLLGVVQAVQGGFSTVALIWSPPPFKIGALAERNPPAAGLLTGETTERLRLELFDVNSPVQVGDSVVTSGFSDTIPAGIPIGRVVAVDFDEAYGRKTAQVFPNAQVGSTREVWVIR